MLLKIVNLRKFGQTCILLYDENTDFFLAFTDTKHIGIFLVAFGGLDVPMQLFSLLPPYFRL